MGQMPGNGISKSTYSCTDPISGMDFNLKYFPVAVAPDECTGNICYCPKTSTKSAWEIQQGRVYTKQSSGSNPSPGMGFGLHLVNVSGHSTTGGLTTQQVEAIFNSKLGDLTTYDAFMDYNVGLYTSSLSTYTDAFDKDGVKYLPIAWTYEGAAWHGVVVQVPGTQMIFELMTDKTSTVSPHVIASSIELEPRLSPAAISRVQSTNADSSILSPVSVNRAASDLDALETFYVTGMKTTMTMDTVDNTTKVSKKCFLWSGASVDVCFTKRADSATKGDFKPADFEAMLNTVHDNLLKNPLCGEDKWVDNHYAIDGHSTSADYIIEYVEANNIKYMCFASNLHYIFDPTGWGIQVDLRFTKTPKGCSSVSLNGGGNPACSLGTCD